MSHPTLAFIGAGNMATAIIKGLIKNGQPQHLVRVCDPSAEQLAKLQADYPQLITTQINAEGVTGADLVVLAVKPQVMAEVCEPLLQAVPELAEKLIVSVAAGISVARLQGLLNAKRIVRTMPNTPCLIGQGMTGLFADANVSPADKHQAEQLMLAVGKTAWVNSEAAMNQVIAASGSAPAYFFLFLRAMQRSLENMGMDAETARQLVQQAGVGSCQLAVSQPDKSLTELTTQVTSKGGTTAEAVGVFETQGLDELVDAAMKACVARAEEMESLF